MSVPVAFEGEVMLLSWSETHSGGAKITLQLQNANDLESFKNMTVAKGKIAGQRLAAVFVEIGEDEQPVEQPKAKAKNGPNCNFAIDICKQKSFWDFCSENFSAYGPIDSEESAKKFILNYIGVSSRKELDSGDFAWNFETLIKEQFLIWKIGNHD